MVRSDLKAKRGEIGVVKGLRIGAAPGPDVGLRQLLKEAGIDAERAAMETANVRAVIVEPRPHHVCLLRHLRGERAEYEAFVMEW